MARQLRLEYPGLLYHVTTRRNERREMFRCDDDRRHWLELLAEAVRRFDWILTSYVLMSNHFHLLVQLATASLSRGMQWLNGKYASWFNNKYTRVGNLVQGRPDMRIVEEESYFLEVHRYNVLNPVRANMVAAPELYEWSSYRATVGLVEAPSWLAVDNVLVHFGPEKNFARESYRRFVADGIGSTRCPWDDLVGGLYLGTPSWVENMQERVELKPRSTDHPFDQRVPVRPDMTTIVDTVANVMRIPVDRICVKRSLVPRMIASWLGCYEAMLPNNVIAAGLRMRSASNVTQLIRKCEQSLGNDAIRECLDRCITTLRRTNSVMKL